MQDNPIQDNKTPMSESLVETPVPTTQQMPQFNPISWTATESIAQTRPKRWYGIIWSIYIILVIIAVALFVFKIISTMTLISSLLLLTAMLIALLLMDKIPARESSYVLTNDSIIVNGVTHKLSEFRAFGVRHNSNLWQLVLVPTKRFSMELVSYIDEQHGEQIVDILASQLPMEEVPENSIDKLINRLKI